jgi:hypothetical protein
MLRESVGSELDKRCRALKKKEKKIRERNRQSFSMHFFCVFLGGNHHQCWYLYFKKIGVRFQHISQETISMKRAKKMPVGQMPRMSLISNDATTASATTENGYKLPSLGLVIYFDRHSSLREIKRERKRCERYNEAYWVAM